MTKIRHIDIARDVAISARDIDVESQVSSMDSDQATGIYVTSEPIHCTGYFGGVVTIHSPSQSTELLGSSNVVSYVIDSVPENNVINYAIDAKIDYVNGGLWIADTGNNRAIKMDLVTKKVNAISDDLCLFPTCIVPNLNGGGAFIKGFSDMETSIVYYIDGNGYKKFSFTYYADMPVESFGCQWFDGDVLVIDANGDSSLISKVTSSGDVINYTNVVSNPQYIAINKFNGNSCIAYDNNGENIIEYRLPDGSTRASVSRDNCSSFPITVDNFSSDFIISSSVSDELNTCERVRFGTQNGNSYLIGNTEYIDGYISPCFSSINRRLYVLNQNGTKINIYNYKGDLSLGVIDIENYGTFSSMKEDFVNGDLWLLSTGGKRILHISSETVQDYLDLSNIVVDFAIESYVRFGERNIYLLSSDGINSCIYKRTYNGGWTSIEKFLIPKDSYRKIDFSQGKGILWFSTKTSLYVMSADGSSSAVKISYNWSDIKGVACYNYLKSYFLSSKYDANSYPPVNTMRYDYVRNRLWWADYSSIYMSDLSNKQVIMQNFTKYKDPKIYGLDIEYESGNAFISMNVSNGRNYIAQVNGDNTEILGYAYLPYRKTGGM